MTQSGAHLQLGSDALSPERIQELGQEFLHREWHRRCAALGPALPAAFDAAQGAAAKKAAEQANDRRRGRRRDGRSRNTRSATVAPNDVLAAMGVMPGMVHSTVGIVSQNVASVGSATVAATTAMRSLSGDTVRLAKQLMQQHADIGQPELPTHFLLSPLFCSLLQYLADASAGAFSLDTLCDRLDDVAEEYSAYCQRRAWVTAEYRLAAGSRVLLAAAVAASAETAVRGGALSLERRSVTLHTTPSASAAARDTDDAGLSTVPGVLDDNGEPYVVGIAATAALDVAEDQSVLVIPPLQQAMQAISESSGVARASTQSTACAQAAVLEDLSASVAHAAELSGGRAGTSATLQASALSSLVRVQADDFDEPGLFARICSAGVMSMFANIAPQLRTLAQVLAAPKASPAGGMPSTTAIGSALAGRQTPSIAVERVLWICHRVQVVPQLAAPEELLAIIANVCAPHLLPYTGQARRLRIMAASQESGLVASSVLQARIRALPTAERMAVTNAAEKLQPELAVTEEPAIPQTGAEWDAADEGVPCAALPGGCVLPEQAVLAGCVWPSHLPPLSLAQLQEVLARLADTLTLPALQLASHKARHAVLKQLKAGLSSRTPASIVNAMNELERSIAAAKSATTDGKPGSTFAVKRKGAHSAPGPAWWQQLLAAWHRADGSSTTAEFTLTRDVAGLNSTGTTAATGAAAGQAKAAKAGSRPRGCSHVPVTYDAMVHAGSAAQLSNLRVDYDTVSAEQLQADVAMKQALQVLAQRAVAFQFAHQASSGGVARLPAEDALVPKLELLLALFGMSTAAGDAQRVPPAAAALAGTSGVAGAAPTASPGALASPTELSEGKSPMLRRMQAHMSASGALPSPSPSPRARSIGRAHARLGGAPASPSSSPGSGFAPGKLPALAMPSARDVALAPLRHLVDVAVRSFLPVNAVLPAGGALPAPCLVQVLLLLSHWTLVDQLAELLRARRLAAFPREHDSAALTAVPLSTFRSLGLLQPPAILEDEPPQQRKKRPADGKARRGGGSARSAAAAAARAAAEAPKWNIQFFEEERAARETWAMHKAVTGATLLPQARAASSLLAEEALKKSAKQATKRYSRAVGKVKKGMIKDLEKAGKPIPAPEKLKLKGTPPAVDLSGTWMPGAAADGSAQAEKARTAGIRTDKYGVLQPSKISAASGALDLPPVLPGLRGDSAITASDGAAPASPTPSLQHMGGVALPKDNSSVELFHSSTTRPAAAVGRNVNLGSSMLAVAAARGVPTAPLSSLAAAEAQRLQVKAAKERNARHAAAMAKYKKAHKDWQAAHDEWEASSANVLKRMRANPHLKLEVPPEPVEPTEPVKEAPPPAQPAEADDFFSMLPALAMVAYEPPPRDMGKGSKGKAGSQPAAPQVARQHIMKTTLGNVLEQQLTSAAILGKGAAAAMAAIRAARAAAERQDAKSGIAAPKAPRGGKPVIMPGNVVDPSDPRVRAATRAHLATGVDGVPMSTSSVAGGAAPSASTRRESPRPNAPWMVATTAVQADPTLGVTMSAADVAHTALMVLLAPPAMDAPSGAGVSPRSGLRSPVFGSAAAEDMGKMATEDRRKLQDSVQQFVDDAEDDVLHELLESVQTIYGATLTVPMSTIAGAVRGVCAAEVTAGLPSLLHIGRRVKALREELGRKFGVQQVLGRAMATSLASSPVGSPGEGWHAGEAPGWTVLHESGHTGWASPRTRRTGLAASVGLAARPGDSIAAVQAAGGAPVASLAERTKGLLEFLSQQLADTAATTPGVSGAMDAVSTASRLRASSTTRAALSMSLANPSHAELLAASVAHSMRGMLVPSHIRDDANPGEAAMQGTLAPSRTAQFGVAEGMLTAAMSKGVARSSVMASLLQPTMPSHVTKAAATAYGPKKSKKRTAPAPAAPSGPQAMDVARGAAAMLLTAPTATIPKVRVQEGTEAAAVMAHVTLDRQQLESFAKSTSAAAGHYTAGGTGTGAGALYGSGGPGIGGDTALLNPCDSDPLLPGVREGQEAAPSGNVLAQALQGMPCSFVPSAALASASAEDDAWRKPPAAAGVHLSAAERSWLRGQPADAVVELNAAVEAWQQACTQYAEDNPGESAELPAVVRVALSFFLARICEADDRPVATLAALACAADAWTGLRARSPLVSPWLTLLAGSLSDMHSHAPAAQAAARAALPARAAYLDAMQAAGHDGPPGEAPRVQISRGLVQASTWLGQCYNNVMVPVARGGFIGPALQAAHSGMSVLAGPQAALSSTLYVHGRDDAGEYVDGLRWWLPDDARDDSDLPALHQSMQRMWNLLSLNAAHLSGLSPHVQAAGQSSLLAPLALGTATSLQGASTSKPGAGAGSAHPLNLTGNVHAATNVRGGDLPDQSIAVSTYSALARRQSELSGSPPDAGLPSLSRALGMPNADDVRRGARELRTAGEYNKLRGGATWVPVSSAPLAQPFAAKTKRSRKK